MAEETDLLYLISMRKQRPSFARMISWEFSCHSSDNTYDKFKKHRTLQSARPDNAGTSIGIPCHLTDDSNSGCSSDESEYFSAEEELWGNETLVLEEESCFLSFKKGEFHSLAKIQPPNARSLSKKKKRKKRIRILYTDDFSTYAESDDFGLVPNDICNDSVESCLRQPQSLVEICLLAHGRSKFKEPMEIPCGLKEKLQTWHLHQSLVRLQLSWLHVLLAQCEPKEHFDEIYFHPLINYKKKQYIQLRLKRNIWNLNFFLEKIDDFNNTDRLSYQNKGEATVYIPHNHEFYDLGTFWSCGEWAYILYHRLLAVLAATVDLMLPATLQCKFVKKNLPQNEDELIAKETETMVARLKMVLRARFPTVIDRCFQEILPYVYMARGNVRLAQASFLSLAERPSPGCMCGNAENCTTCKVTRKWTGRHKAMYLSEIAHMHSLFGDEEIAVKFHRLAADTAMESYAHFVKRYEITLQTLIVVANVFNQGVLTDKKARKSQSAWNEALRFSKMSKISLDGADETAFISMLCFHGRYSASQENWLEEFRDKLNVAIKSSNSRNMLHLHLSFLCALMKDEKLSRRHYNLSSSIEDHEFPPDIQAKENPWVLLINILQSQPMTPKPLQVVWRRELSPMIILPMEDNHLYHREADVQPFDLNLRFTEDGYLTGNMQMMMPPIRGVYLDPYDGSLCLTSVPGNTQPWNAMTNCWKDYGKQQRPACPLIPTMMELYCDRTGNRVHLLMTESGSICVEKMTGNLATIYWTEPSQKKAKINLVHLLKVKIREYVDNEIEREFTKRMSAVRGFEKEKQKSWKGIEKSRKDAKDLLHYCFIRNWKMSLEQLLFQHAYEPVRENMKVKRSTRDDFCKKEEKKERKNRQKMRKFLKCDPFIVELTALPQIYGHTVFLILLCCNKTVWLFLNCTSRDSFRKPKVIVEPMPEFGESVRHSHQWLFGNYNPMCKVGLIPVSLHPQQLFAVTEAGDVCDYLSATSLMEDDGFLQPTVCVFGESIFCIDNDPTDRNSNRLQRRRSQRFDPELDMRYPKNKKKVAWVISVTVFVNDTARDKMESDVTIIAREKILCQHC